MIHDPYNRSIQSIRYPITPSLCTLSIQSLNSVDQTPRHTSSVVLLVFMLQALPPLSPHLFKSSRLTPPLVTPSLPLCVTMTVPSPLQPLT